MEELKVSKIQDIVKLDVVCQAQYSKNCSTKENPFGYILGCDEDCPDHPHDRAYGETSVLYR